MEFVLLSSHNDVIHDISFDFYGTRFATCSSDRLIKIWDLTLRHRISDSRDEDGNNILQHSSDAVGGGAALTKDGAASGHQRENNSNKNEWTKTEFRAHSDSIWGLSWAHPEFGSVLASCSEDRTICIWEEKEVLTQPVAAAADKSERWIKRATLTESKKAVTDVKFAPRFHGFLLAATSADGCVRIYEAPDAFSLNYWQLHDTLFVERIVTEVSGRGINSNSGGELGVNNNSLSSSGSSSITSSNSGFVRESEYGLTCIAWSDSPVEAARVAVGATPRLCRYGSKTANLISGARSWSLINKRASCTRLHGHQRWGDRTTR